MGRWRRGLTFVAVILALAAIGWGCLAWLSRLLPSTLAARKVLPVAEPTGTAIGYPSVRVLVVQVDGLTEAATDPMPALQALGAHGAHGSLRYQPYSDAYAQLATGSGPQTSGAPLLSEAHPADLGDDLLAAARRAGLEVLLLAPADSASDAERMTRALAALEAPPHLLWLRLEALGTAVSGAGPSSDEAASAALTVDAQLRALADSVDLTTSCMVVVSEGTEGNLGGLPAQRSGVWSLTGAGIEPGALDPVVSSAFAPTLAALLGIAPPALCEGDAALDALAFDDTRAGAWLLAHAQQRATLAQASVASNGGPGTSESVLSDLASAEECLRAGNVPAARQLARFSLRTASADMSAAANARLASERLHRVPLAIVLALLPVALFLARARGLHWYLFVCATVVPVMLVYLYQRAGAPAHLPALAPLRPTLQRSAVYTAVAVGLGLLPALTGCVVSYLRAPRRRVLELGTAVGVYGLMVSYLTLLPAIAAFAWYGLRVTWHLPEPLHLYVQALSLLHTLMAAVLLLLVPWPTMLLALPAALRGREPRLKRLNLVEATHAHRRHRK